MEAQRRVIAGVVVAVVVQLLVMQVVVVGARVCADHSPPGTSDCIEQQNSLQWLPREAKQYKNPYHQQEEGQQNLHTMQNRGIDAHKKCRPTSFLVGKDHKCNGDYYADCCHAGESYPQYKCSPPVSASTLANLTLNDFSEGGDGGGPAACDGKYHPRSQKVVALSTGWFNNGKRCNKKIRIFLDDKSVEAKVVDECDSFNGCDKVHDYQIPCDNNIVDASIAVWKALGISEDDPRFGLTEVHWADV